MTRDEIVDFIGASFPDEEVVLFDGLEDAFIGIAERFEPVSVVRVGGPEDGLVSEKTEGGVHRLFAVYDYDKMVEILAVDGSDVDEAIEYIAFNVIGLYAGPNTPAILYRKEP